MKPMHSINWTKSTEVTTESIRRKALGLIDATYGRNRNTNAVPPALPLRINGRTYYGNSTNMAQRFAMYRIHLRRRSVRRRATGRY